MYEMQRQLPIKLYLLKLINSVHLTCKTKKYIVKPYAYLANLALK